MIEDRIRAMARAAGLDESIDAVALGKTVAQYCAIVAEHGTGGPGAGPAIRRGFGLPQRAVAGKTVVPDATRRLQALRGAEPDILGLLKRRRMQSIAADLGVTYAARRCIDEGSVKNLAKLKRANQIAAEASQRFLDVLADMAARPAVTVLS